MKCVCGYECVVIVEDCCDFNPQFEVGNREFFKANLTLTINEKQGDWDHDRLVFKDVYVCPKCGTLKVDI